MNEFDPKKLVEALRNAGHSIDAETETAVVAEYGRVTQFTELLQRIRVTVDESVAMLPADEGRLFVEILIQLLRERSDDGAYGLTMVPSIRSAKTST